MLLQSHAHPGTFSLPRTHPRRSLHIFPRKFSKPTCSLSLGLDDIVQIAHNKVLVAAALSAAIGQLSKPFTSVLLYGKDLDFRTTVQAGGFPSTHSSSVVAAATSLALERGFSDSIFGLTVVYAGLVMYDSQGALPPESRTATAYESKVSEENRARTELLSREDERGVAVEKVEDKVEDPTGKGGPSFGAGRDENRDDLGVTGTAG